MESQASDPAAASGSAESFVHQALIYGSDQEFLDVVRPFVEDGVASAEPTLVAVRERNVKNLRSALGGAPPSVTLFSVEQWYDTSARTRDKFARWVAENAESGGQSRRVRVVGEPPWAVGSDAQLRDWARHESVLNVAFAEYPLTFICTYDARALPDQVIGYARSTHPEIVDSGGARGSDVYEDPFEFCRRLDGAVSDRDSHPLVEISFGVVDLPALRRLVESAALSAGLTRRRSEELVLAVNEIATNALLHGRPPATLRIRNAGRELVCEVSDAGEGIKDALAGQLAPPAAGLGGRGLWMTRLLCDAVEVGNGEGCTVSMHVTTPSGHPASRAA